ncbi:DUF6886 family protein [Oceanobacillus manasiensis]|uniref:DUF6886 family protein n=1 Tax=Oceanobacillus manasiensis TaxID=586413 RepID=UPI0005AB054F|nr:DUF6886 family protein [Oceanobacillus manasiensis]
MRLFHVSEESNIDVFHPRIPERGDLDKNKPLVWAVDENCLANFLTPRNCPRVCFQISPKTTIEDRKAYLKLSNHVVAVEKAWLQRINETTLYLYEFGSEGFKLQDESAGYYVSEIIQTPSRKIVIEDIVHVLSKYNVELRKLERLWELHDNIINSSFRWSMCRMRFAQPREV